MKTTDRVVIPRGSFLQELHQLVGSVLPRNCLTVCTVGIFKHCCTPTAASVRSNHLDIGVYIVHIDELFSHPPAPASTEMF